MKVTRHGDQYMTCQAYQGRTVVERPFGPFTVGASVAYVGEAFNDDDNTQRLDEYTLLGLRASYRFNAAWTARLTVDNLLDEDYYFRGVDVSPVGRVPQPGRSFILEAQLDF